MPSSGSGSMTPVPVGAAFSTYEPPVYTLLSLFRYAKIMGISPLHFAGGLTPGLNPIIFPDLGCDSIWFQYDWQANDKVSRDSLARSIKSAEDDLASFLGYQVAPTWVEEEVHNYTRPYVREYFGTGADVRGQYKTIKTQYGKFISSGRRAVSLIGSATTALATLVYSDDDSDGFYETATISLPTSLDSSLACQVKVFYSGYSDPEWEIRPFRSISISGGTLTIVLYSWQLVDPDLWAAYPTDAGAHAIDCSTTANFLTTVDVYREYIDESVASVQFFWENGLPSGTYVCPFCAGSGCTVCNYTTQDGCSIARDVNAGVIVPMPGEYDTANSVWNRSSWTGSREPDIVKIWYKSGAQSDLYLKGRSCDALSEFWAQNIAWLATARLERPMCACGNLVALSEYLREDLTETSGNMRRFVVPDALDNPFGTRRGEVMVWSKLKRLVRDRQFSVALV